jgi:hypothetical protein
VTVCQSDICKWTVTVKEKILSIYPQYHRFVGSSFKS